MIYWIFIKHIKGFMVETLWKFPLYKLSWPCAFFFLAYSVIGYQSSNPIYLKTINKLLLYWYTCTIKWETNNRIQQGTSYWSTTLKYKFSYSYFTGVFTFSATLFHHIFQVNIVILLDLNQTLVTRIKNKQTKNRQ